MDERINDIMYSRKNAWAFLVNFDLLREENNRLKKELVTFKKNRVIEPAETKAAYMDLDD
jgi:nuclear transport factor 2 (NTF2) superfamily protein